MDLYCYILIVLFFTGKIKSSEPDITLLSYVGNGDYNINCVIGSTEIDNSVVLIAPLSEDFETEVRYLPYTEKYNNCDFELECANKYIDDNWERQSDDKLLSIIGDIRFEQLETINTKNSKHKIEVKEEEFYLSFSVRAESDPHILLCENFLSDVKTFCYWISIEFQTGNYIQYSMRNCSKVKNTTLVTNSKCGMPNGYSHPKLKVNMEQKSNWFHFAIIKTNNKLILKDSFTYEQFVERDLENRNKINFIYFFTHQESGEWKIHKNSFLKLKTFNVPVELSPIFSVSKCVSMFVYISNGCTLKIWINNDEVKKVEGNNSWQNIKLFSKETNYKIFVQGSRKSESDTIAIDNIRHCQKDEIRVLSALISYKQYSPLKLACKTLTNITMYASYSTTQNLEKVCDNSSYIGKDCNIPCSLVFGKENEFCNNNLICIPTTPNESNCTCASGYNGKICTDYCINKFGYNCRNQCGKCKNNENCLKSTGYCPLGCESDYIPDFCLKGKYEPTDLNYKLDNETLNIVWTHPIVTDNSLSEYKVYVNKTDGKQDYSNSPKIVKYPTNSCQVPISRCSKYTIEVCGNRKQCIKKDISIPAPVPELSSLIKIENIANQTETKNLTIPGIKNGTHCEQSFVHISICNETDTLNTTTDNSNMGILSLIDCPGRKWIAAGNIKANVSEKSIIIGDYKKISDEYENPPLTHNCVFNICVVLENIYENVTKYNTYCEISDSNQDYNEPLLWIILGPVLGIIFIMILVIGVIKYCSIIKGRKPNVIPETENLTFFK